MSAPQRIRGRLVGWMVACVTGLAPVTAQAQLNPDQTPKELEGVRIDQKIGSQIPLELSFTDSTGKAVKLKDYFNGQRPVILTLNYFRCPMLCTLQLNGMVEALKEVELNPSEDFDIITVSFDPLEDTPLAAAKKRTYLGEYGNPKAGRGWHFLTGSTDSIKALTDAVGFHFRWNKEANQWAHKAALILCTPKGKVSRYLGGVMFEPKTLRLSLVEASQGKIGSLADQIFLCCFQWTDSTGKYTASVMGIMRLAGGVTVAALVIVILSLRQMEHWRRRRAARAAGSAGPPGSTAGGTVGRHGLQA